MKISDLNLTEDRAILDRLKNFAKTHYSDAKNENEALLLLFARSLMHSEEDSKKHDLEIAELKNDVNLLKSKVSDK